MEYRYNVNVSVDLQKLKNNILHSYELCKKKSIDLAVVVKSICTDEKILETVEKTPVTTIADSRLENFEKMKTAKRKFLIRPIAPFEAADLVRLCDLSLQSELISIQSIEAAAEAAGTTHDILLMIDMGDMRDGLFYTAEDEILEMARYIHASRFLRLAGVATNYNCLRGYLADTENMKRFIDVHHMIEEEELYDVPRPIVSGGASSSVAFLTGRDQGLPDEINQFRMGEAIMLGRDPSDNTFIDGYEIDVFTLRAPLMEVQVKPVGSRDGGETVLMRRGIINVGKQDMQLEHLIPRDPRIHVLGGCSDECVLEMDNAPGYIVGDMVEFDLEYGALMTAFAGSFIHKTYLEALNEQV